MHPGLSKKKLKKMRRRPDFYETKYAAGKIYQTKCAAVQNF